MSDINKFENHNSSISVNVIGYEKVVYPLRISKHNYKRESTVNLLLISDDITVGSKMYVNCYLYKHQKMVMLDMCVLDVVILSKPRNR